MDLKEIKFDAIPAALLAYSLEKILSSMLLMIGFIFALTAPFLMVEIVVQVSTAKICLRFVLLWVSHRLSLRSKSRPSAKLPQNSQLLQLTTRLFPLLIPVLQSKLLIPPEKNNTVRV
ncbi:hypothetical protein CEXT_30081 [Caerostris extrusa]|uniref:Uncharacterized protein n=1 Tax=Caerostris extrusa TaxID=172846 RepID=A0AAV4VTI9_CAEEX|nr:hypothetical protein CEXT_30081 [Caerostris extrusa]